jgi:hypothetical protein
MDLSINEGTLVVSGGPGDSLRSAMGEDVGPFEFDLIPCSSQEQEDAEPLP